MPESQTMEEPRQGEQPSTLQFVHVAVTSSRTHLPVRNSAQERSIRAHVMRDYLQQRVLSSKPRNTSPAVSKLSDHLSQFRLASRRDQKRSRRGSKQFSADEHTSASASALVKMRPIVPKDHQILSEVVLARSVANDMLSLLHSPITTSTPGTLALLEYYHTSFWDNSLAVNPEGKWMSVAISEPAILHATLCLVALHKFQTHLEPQANSYFWHRGEAIRLISKYLADPEHATSDATIGAVAVLSGADNSANWPSNTQTSHIEGMITLVRLRGGIDGMSTNRYIKRVVAWADILHATAHNSLPQFGIAPDTAHREMKRLMDVLKQHRRSSLARQDIVPAFFRKVFQDLQTLAMARSLLKEEAVSSLQELRQLFSSLLFVTEYRILDLGHAVSSSDSVMGNVTGLEVVKAAALIFAFHGLRDIAITAAFFDSLAQRLRDGLSGIFDRASNCQSPTYISDEALAAPFLLWLCLNGWIASAVKTRQKDREFFVENAAMLCESAGIDSLEELSSHMRRIIFLSEYYLPACSDLWAEIRTWTATHDVE